LAAPRRIRTVIGLIASPLLLLISAVTLFASTRAVALFFGNVETRDLAASIEKGSAPEADYLERFVKAKGLDRVAADCSDIGTRATLTVTLANLEAAANQNAAPLLVDAENSAVQAVKHRLACNPLDGNAWLRFAMIDSLGRQPQVDVIEALRLSYWSTPNESWIIETRLPFATKLYLAGVTGFEREYGDDLRHYAAFQSTRQVAATYVETSTAIRKLLHPLIEAQPESRKKAIADEIDRLGVDFQRQ
jgi:hypothetical protein